MFELVLIKNLHPIVLEDVLKTLNDLLKKKFLLKRDDLVLPWKPLHELLVFYEESASASRGTRKSTKGFRSQLHNLIKYARSYWPDEATKEMIELWSPKLCPYDQSFPYAMRYTVH